MQLVDGHRGVEPVARGARLPSTRRPASPTRATRPASPWPARARNRSRRDRPCRRCNRSPPRRSGTCRPVRVVRPGRCPPRCPSRRRAAASASSCRPPAVPVADHRDLGGIRRPDRERGSAALEQMTSELVVQLAVGSLPEQIDIVLGQQSDLLLRRIERRIGSPEHRDSSTLPSCKRAGGSACRTLAEGRRAQVAAPQPMYRIAAPHGRSPSGR